MRATATTWSGLKVPMAGKGEFPSVPKPPSSAPVASTAGLRGQNSAGALSATATSDASMGDQSRPQVSSLRPAEDIAYADDYVEGLKLAIEALCRGAVELARLGLEPATLGAAGVGGLAQSSAVPIVSLRQ